MKNVWGGSEQGVILSSAIKGKKKKVERVQISQKPTLLDFQTDLHVLGGRMIEPRIEATNTGGS